MKLLTATARTRGQDPRDFCWTVEGELVYLGLVCDRDLRHPDLRHPDEGCGCGRAFSGLNSHKATTTALVRELDFIRDDFLEAVAPASNKPGGAEHTPRSSPLS